MPSRPSARTYVDDRVELPQVNRSFPCLPFVGLLMLLLLRIDWPMRARRGGSQIGRGMDPDPARALRDPSYTPPWVMPVASQGPAPLLRKRIRVGVEDERLDNVDQTVQSCDLVAFSPRSDRCPEVPKRSQPLTHRALVPYDETGPARRMFHHICGSLPAQRPCLPYSQTETG